VFASASSAGRRAFRSNSWSVTRNTCEQTTPTRDRAVVALPRDRGFDDRLGSSNAQVRRRRRLAAGKRNAS
jgi:hypothetical protein